MKSDRQLKLFKRQIAGQADRYRHISTHLQRARLPFMVDFQYLDEGVRIRGAWFPVPKVHWVFKEQDFNSPTDSEVFQTLWKLPDTACRALVGRLGSAHQ